MIQCENNNSPISDDEIVEELKKHNIGVARRTVAKYRKVQNIPASFMRKRQNKLRGLLQPRHELRQKLTQKDLGINIIISVNKDAIFKAPTTTVSSTNKFRASGNPPKLRGRKSKISRQ